MRHSKKRILFEITILLFLFCSGYIIGTQMTRVFLFFSAAAEPVQCIKDGSCQVYKPPVKKLQATADNPYDPVEKKLQAMMDKHYRSNPCNQHIQEPMETITLKLN